MRKNKWPMIMIYLLLSGCGQKSFQTLISRWEQSQEESSVKRRLASVDPGQCFKNNFNIKELKSQVMELEKKYLRAKKVSGFWRHLNLSDLPVPQANFLLSFGKRIGDLNNPESIDYSSCRDLICILNKIYGKEEDVSGYVHYIWYLKFGNMLSADNLVPRQESKIPGEYNGKKISLDKYLFSEKELYAFWRLSFMLENSHNHLSSLSEIQRIPRGELSEGKNAQACGLASREGWIWLNDMCLVVYNYDRDDGALYQNVTHELSHILDFELGAKVQSSNISETKDYLKVSGFYLSEYNDDKGYKHREWNKKDDIKLFNNYSGISPSENFAVTAAYFRVEGDHLKEKISSDHYQFISKSIFHEKFFEKEYLLKEWINSSIPEITGEALKALLDCSEDSTVRDSSFFLKEDFPNLNFGMINCLGDRANMIYQHLTSQTMSLEPDGCLILEDPPLEESWKRSIKEELKIILKNLFQDLNEDKKYLNQLNKFQKKMDNKTIAQHSFINCFGEYEENICYVENVRIQIQEASHNQGLYPSHLKMIEDIYLKSHTFGNTINEIKKSYQSLISAHQQMIRTKTMLAWDRCELLQHNDDEIPSGNFFHISDGYMVSSFYNCLNTYIPDLLSEIIQDFRVEAFKVEHAKEKNIMATELLPQVVKILTDIYHAKRDNERHLSLTALHEDSGQIRAKLIANFNWIDGKLDPKDILSHCMKKAYQFIDLKPLYHLPKDLFSSYLENTSCFKITSTQEFQHWLIGSKEEFRVKFQARLENNVYELGEKRAEDCLKFKKKQKKICLIENWEDLEAQVLQQAAEDPVVLTFKLSVQDLKKKLEIKREQIQQKLIQKSQ
jgi:hypothetical protein